MRKSMLMKSAVFGFAFAAMLAITPNMADAAESKETTPTIYVNYKTEMLQVEDAEIGKKVFVEKVNSADKMKDQDYVTVNKNGEAQFDVSNWIGGKETTIYVKIGKNTTAEPVTIQPQVKIKDATDLATYQFKVEAKQGDLASAQSVTATVTYADGSTETKEEKIIAGVKNTEVTSEGLEIKKGKNGKWMTIQSAAWSWTGANPDLEEGHSYSEYDKAIIQKFQKSGATLYLRVRAYNNPTATNSIYEDEYAYYSNKEVTKVVTKPDTIAAPASAEVKIKIAKLKKGPSIKVNVTDKNLTGDADGATIKLAKNVQWRFAKASVSEDSEEGWSKKSSSAGTLKLSDTADLEAGGKMADSISSLVYGTDPAGTGATDAELEFRTGADTSGKKAKPASKITTVTIPKAVHIAGIASGTSNTILATNASVGAEKALIKLTYGTEAKGKIPVTIKVEDAYGVLKAGEVTRSVSYQLEGSTKWTKIKATGATLKLTPEDVKKLENAKFRIDGLAASKKTGNVAYVASRPVSMKTTFTGGGNNGGSETPDVPAKSDCVEIKEVEIVGATNSKFNSTNYNAATKTFTCNVGVWDPTSSGIAGGITTPYTITSDDIKLTVTDGSLATFEIISGAEFLNNSNTYTNATVKIRVTAEDGTTTEEYTLNIIRTAS